MSQTHDVGPFYLHTMHYPKYAPRIERAFTTEIEKPYRLGKGVCLRFRSIALVIGKWGKPSKEIADEVLAKLNPKPVYFETDEIRMWPTLGESNVLEQREALPSR